jgi:hypothetical protein
MSLKTATASRISALHTPTDLKPSAVPDITAALNVLLVDMFALYLKTKNFHWHMSGPHFRDYHLLLDEQGEQIFATTDDIAERVRADLRHHGWHCRARPQTVAELALRQNLPAVTLFPDFARAGGLMAYGPNLLDMYRQSGVMIGKVLQGKKLADLPIERPTQFEFVVNLKTAKTLGVTIPDLYPVARRRGDRVTILFCGAALVR